MNKEGKLYQFLRKIYHALPFKKKQALIDNIDMSYEKLDKEEFFNKISSYDVVSFDIFDTLLTRIIYNPDDIFLLMGEKLGDSDFFRKRKEAEKKANEELQKDVNLDEIYKFYEKLYQEDSKQIKQLEEELEISLCIPRLDMLDVYHRLKDQKNYVILTSDMYLPKTVIEKMLKKCGYEGYDAFYLSNDIDKRKDKKDIWPYLVDKYPHKSIIHIGDNEKSDYCYPKDFGIDSIKIESGKQLFSKLSIYPYIEEFISNNISNSLLLGLLINKKWFNSPFAELQIDSLDDFGYLFHAPILNQFLAFLVKESKKSDQLLFLAREGYYLQKLYQDYCQIYHIKEKPNVYFLASRKATSTANIQSREDIETLLSNEFTGTIKSFYQQILEVEYLESDEPIHLPKDKEKVLKNLDKYESQILECMKLEKDNYLSYMKEILGDYKKKNLIIVDLGYSGTIQYQLTKLTKKEMTGVYLTNSENVKKYSRKSKLKFLFDINECEEFKKIYHYSLILEFFLSAPYGQLLKFKKENGKIVPVYNEESIDENKKQALEVIYQSVLDYMQDVYNLKQIYDLTIDIRLLCRLYVCIVEGNLISKQVKDQFDFIDSFCASESRNVFKIISRY